MNNSRALPAGLDFAPPEEATWLGQALTQSGNVTSLVPVGYEAYARVLHPASLRIGSSPEKRDVPWRVVAERLETTAHASMERASITRDWRYLTSSGISGRLWCVSTDVDLPSTLIGVSRSCVRDMLESPDLELWAAVPDQDISWRADTLNPHPAGAPEDV